MTSAEAFLVDGEARLVLGTEFAQRELVKLIPGSAWAKDAPNPLTNGNGFWHLPLSWSAYLSVQGVLGAIEFGPAAQSWAYQDYQTRVLPTLNLRGSIDAPGWGPDGLRDDQRVGVAMLVVGRHVTLGDDTGTGKTVMGSVAASTAAKILRGELSDPAGGEPVVPKAQVRICIVCPSKVRRGWENELAKWAPELRVGIVRGDVNKRRAVIDKVRDGELDVLVINWENLRNHSRLAPYGSVALRTCEVCDRTSTKKHQSCERCVRDLNLVDFDIVIADEVHRCKDPKAKWSRALWQIAHGSPSLRYAWGLTATATEDACDDFWSIGHFMAPLEYPSKIKYVDRYALQTWNAFGGMDVVGIRPETRDEFFGFFDPRFLRRPRAYSLANVLEPVREDRIAEMTPKQKKLYNEIADEMIGRLDDGDVVLATNPLVQTGLLNRAAASFLEQRDCVRCLGSGATPDAHEAIPHPDPQYALAWCYCARPFDDPVHFTKCRTCNGRGHNYHPALPSNKIDALIELLDDIPKRERVVVFAVSRQLIELASLQLTKRKISHGLITGAVSETQTYANVDAFRAGEFRVMLVVIDAGGEGLDGLQCAQIGVFMQRHYSSLKNKQAEGRLVRGGQEGQTVFIDIRSENTIEDDKEVILAQKEGRFQELVRDDETLRRLLALRP